MISTLKNFILAILLAMPFISISQEVIKITLGKVQGYTQDHIRIFKGIPFAEPPVGNLRWKAPQPLQPWSGIKKCLAFSASPMQSKPTPFMFWSKEFLIPESPISEDCLYLNVWTGAQQATEKRPVLVYIYGGGFRSGGAGCPIYDGKAMAEKGIIFVSINYRVGVFGFLSHPELTKESAQHTSGNYALLDMIAALKWVKQNIRAFGGDPARVTIAGQSAGAFGVNYLTASPLAKGLFHRAIAESGGSFYVNPARPAMDLKRAELLGITYASNVHCATIRELRSKPAEEILNAEGGMSFPIIDGVVIPTTVAETYKKGKQNDVPIIVGWNKDDKVMNKTLEASVFKDQMIKRFGDHADAFFKAYPSNTQEESDHTQFNLSRDETFGLQDYAWAKIQSQTGKAKAYMYNFNRQVPAYSSETAYGAFHSGEIVYAYDNLKTVDRPWEPIDQSIATKMSSYWVNFIKSGDPNGKDLPRWEHYDMQRETTLIIDKVIESKPIPSKAQFTFWENYYNAIK